VEESNDAATRRAAARALAAAVTADPSMPAGPDPPAAAIARRR
jgi:hypothetical protein